MAGLLRLTMVVGYLAFCIGGSSGCVGKKRPFLDGPGADPSVGASGRGGEADDAGRRVATRDTPIGDGGSSPPRTSNETAPDAPSTAAVGSPDQGILDAGMLRDVEQPPLCSPTLAIVDGFEDGDLLASVGGVWTPAGISRSMPIRLVPALG